MSEKNIEVMCVFFEPERQFEGTPWETEYERNQTRPAGSPAGKTIIGTVRQTDEPYIGAARQADEPYIGAARQADEPHIGAARQADQPHIRTDRSVIGTDRKADKSFLRQ